MEYGDDSIVDPNNTTTNLQLANLAQQFLKLINRNNSLVVRTILVLKLDEDNVLQAYMILVKWSTNGQRTLLILCYAQLTTLSQAAEVWQGLCNCDVI